MSDRTRPEVSTHAHAHATHPGTAAPEPTADHPAMGHGAHAGHDMSDARMAEAMEADMRRRFWISLALAIPVVLYSPLATNVFKLYLPTPFGIPHEWVMLLFSTPVALWTSSVFHVGAYYSLRPGLLNMNVLVSLGILTSYLFSFGLTLLAEGKTLMLVAVDGRPVSLRRLIRFAPQRPKPSPSSRRSASSRS